MAARKILPPNIGVDDRPSDLRDLFKGSERNYGLAPEAKIFSKTNDRLFFVEVKKQGPDGNAEERGMKLFTSRLEEVLRDRYGFPYHPYVIVFCENLATDDKYVAKLPYLLQPSSYLLWKNYDPDILQEYLLAKCREWQLFG